MELEATLLSVFAMYLACGFFAGALIGCIGIGGVVLVPLLVYFGDVDIKLAISAAMFCLYCFGACWHVHLCPKQINTMVDGIDIIYWCCSWCFIG